MASLKGIFRRGARQGPNSKVEVKEVKASSGDSGNAGAIGPFPLVNGVTTTSTIFDLPRARYSRSYSTYARYYAENVYLFRAIDYLANAIAGIKLELYSDSSKEKKYETHPFLDLLNKPSGDTSQVELIKSFVSYSALSGNGYMYATKSASGKPIGLWALPPQGMDITVNKFNQKIYKYTSNTPQPQLIDNKSLLHYRAFNPASILYGLSPVAVAAALIEQFDSGVEWQLSLLRNSGRPSGALITQQTLSEPSFNNLKEQMEENFTGPENAGKPMVLDGGLDWKSFSMSPLELDWGKSKESIARDIALAIGVPPILLDQGQATYSNYQEARLSFFVETVLPFLDLLMSKFNAWLPDLYPGEKLYLAYAKDDIEALQEDRTAVVTRVNAQHTTGYITANEARKLSGLDEIDGFDFIIVDGAKRVQIKDIIEYTKLPSANSGGINPNGNATPNGGVGATGDNGPDPSLASGSGSQGNNQDPSGQTKPSQGDNNNQPPNQGPQKSKRVTRRLHPVDIKALNLKTEEKSLYWQSFESKREGWYESVQKKAQDYFKDQQVTVLKAVDKAAMPESVALHVDNALTNTDGLAKLLATTYMGVGEDFGKATFNAIKARVGAGKASNPSGNFNENDSRNPKDPNYLDPTVGFDIWKSVVVDWLTENSSTKIVQINDTTRQIIRDKLAEGVKAGESINQLADRIRGLYNEFYQGRSESIARTEVISASNLGSLAGATQLGLKLDKEWISTYDDRTREAHKHADGQVVPLDKPFVVAGDKLSFPGDSSKGAKANNVIQCRCTLGYKTLDDTEREDDPIPSDSTGKGIERSQNDHKGHAHIDMPNYTVDELTAFRRDLRRLTDKARKRMEVRV